MEEEERRQLRRERNKVAASRCRVKRKCHVKKLLKVTVKLIPSIGKLKVKSKSKFLVFSWLFFLLKAIIDLLVDRKRNYLTTAVFNR